MLYFFIGKDRERLRKEATSLRDGLLKRKPDASVVRFDGESFRLGDFEAALFGQGLFNAASILYCDGVLSNADAKNFFLTRAGEIGASANVCIVLEERVDAATGKKLLSHAKQIIKGDLDEKRLFSLGEGRTISSKTFNVFSLADAFAGRDKAKLFSLYHEALRFDIPLEEIVGTLFWQVKALSSASSAQSPAEADLKPYAYAKAKMAARNYEKGELIDLSRKLVSLYHDAHAGVRNFEYGLEKLILSL